MLLYSSEVWIGITGKLNHARLKLPETNDNINRLFTQIATLSSTENSRRECQRHMNYAALNSRNTQYYVFQDSVGISDLES